MTSTQSRLETDIYQVALGFFATALIIVSWREWERARANRGLSMLRPVYALGVVWAVLAVWLAAGMNWQPTSLPEAIFVLVLASLGVTVAAYVVWMLGLSLYEWVYKITHSVATRTRAIVRRPVSLTEARQNRVFYEQMLRQSFPWLGFNIPVGWENDLASGAPGILYSGAFQPWCQWRHAEAVIDTGGTWVSLDHPGIPPIRFKTSFLQALGIPALVFITAGTAVLAR